MGFLVVPKVQEVLNKKDHVRDVKWTCKATEKDAVSKYKTIRAT